MAQLETHSLLIAIVSFHQPDWQEDLGATAVSGLLGVMAASLLLTWTLGDSKPRQELSTAHVASYWCSLGCRSVRVCECRVFFCGATVANLGVGREWELCVIEGIAHGFLQNAQGLMLFLWGAFLATTVPPLKMTCEQLEDVGGIIPGSQSICEGLWRIPAAWWHETWEGFESEPAIHCSHC